MDTVLKYIVQQNVCSLEHCGVSLKITLKQTDITVILHSREYEKHMKSHF